MNHEPIFALTLGCIRNRRRSGYQLASGFMAVLVAGCTSYGPGGIPDGASESRIVGSMGAPTARFSRPDKGQRLEFRRGPAGRHTYMLDFDADGRLVHREQVLDAAHFGALSIGMTKDEVLYRIGHPGMVMALTYQRRQLWSYRYDAPVCQLFQVSFDQDERAVEVGFGRDPTCDPDRD